MEISEDPAYLRPGERVIVYPKFLDKLTIVLATGNVGHDPVHSRWPTYEKILQEIQPWPVENHPVVICEDDLCVY
jgi:hypothetical protein